MKIALLGDSRFLGVAVAEAAMAAGHEVRIFHSGKYEPILDGAHYEVAPRSEPDTLRRCLREFGPEVVIDTFAMTSQGAQDAIAAIAGLATRVVVLSSQDVYAQFGHLLGHTADRIDDEVSENSPLTVPFPFRGIASHAGGPDYDKKDVERAYFAADSSFDSLSILRLPAVYGRRDTKRRFGFIVDHFDGGGREIPRKAGAMWRWTHGHIETMTQAILAVCERTASTVLNLGDSETPTMGEWVEGIAERMQIDFEWRDADELPRGFSYLGTMPCDFVADTRKAWKSLAIEEASFEERIDDMIDWLRRSRDA